jgi:hypothetical protein
MTDWSQLSHAYGSAENIPALLDQLEPDPAAECWEELWSHLCPQGTVYPAGFAALPRLTAAAGAWAPEDRVMALALAGAIVAGARGTDGDDVRGRYPAELATLLRLTDESLRSPSLSDDPDGYVQLLQASLAFEDVPVWDEHLEGLAGEEYQVDCPGCEADLFVAMGEYGFFVSKEDYAVEEDAKRTPLLPADPGELDGLPARLYAAAREADQDKVANGLTYLFGAATCTECGAAFSVAERVAGAHAR